MNDRNLSSPILHVIVLSLLAATIFPSRGATAASDFAPPAALGLPASAPVPNAPVAAPAKHAGTYTVKAGESLTSIAQKFNTTRKKLKALNDLATNSVKPGQVLLIPSLKSAKPATTVASTPHPSAVKTHREYLRAQPVQDFDIPASTFASCPEPPTATDEDADSSGTAVAVTPAPLSNSAPAAQSTTSTFNRSAGSGADVHQATGPAPATSGPVKFVAKATPDYSAVAANSSPPGANPATPRPNAHGLTSGLGRLPLFGPMFAPPSPTDWGTRFLTEARSLGNQGIEYNDDWRPPGEAHAWTMDCSNTTRYIYKVTTGIQLPRTASDQYYYLHLQGKAWDVPQTAQGWADTNFLRENLKPGDLLFWENTYRPERQPPITHVMVFLGSNEKGQWIMAGSQGSRGGEHNRRNGGPDVYVFRPSQACGGYTTWLGMVRHQGRFCAFGRPLEADRSKLAVAAND